jgi:hypothetical protein
MFHRELIWDQFASSGLSTEYRRFLITSVFSSTLMTCSYFFLSVDSRTVWKFSRNWTNFRSGKCKTIAFARSRHPVKFSYMLDGTVLDRVCSINDLGVIMDEKMTFSEHLDVMVAKAFAMLGLIRILSLEFRDPYILKSLFTSLVRPKLEYASCVWNPF